jgi:hypothetical protein
MKIIKIENFNHEWVVRDKVKTHELTYYLLVDKNNPKMLKAVKESNSPLFSFSGKIEKIPDEKKTFKRTVLKVNKIKPSGLSEVEIEEPYIHNINDFAECGEEEAEKIFGVKRVLVEDQYGNQEFLFYLPKSKEENKEDTVSKEQKSSKKSKE